MVLKEKTQEAFDFIKNHGGSCTTAEIMNGLGLEKIASVTGRVNSLVKNGLATTEDGGKTEENLFIGNRKSDIADIYVWR